MCTMTWFVKEHGYELFFNRDESVNRRRAKLPSIQSDQGTSYISPTDADAGGTWIASNQFGITVCLLNHYQFEQLASYQDWTSRGEIVRRFATTEDIYLAESEFSELKLHDYRAFRMFIINQQGINCLCIWDGHSARVERNVKTPKFSSSIDAQHVKVVRKNLFLDQQLKQSQDTAKFLQFHSSHHPTESPESVCMHSPEGNTVSLSHVSVDLKSVDFSYADGPPCVAALSEPISIQLAAHVDRTEASVTKIDRAAVSLP